MTITADTQTDAASRPSARHDHGEAIVRSRHVVAMSVPIVYNIDGDCDRDGMVFAIKAHEPLLRWIRDRLTEGDERLLRLHVAQQRAQVVIDGVDKLGHMIERLDEEAETPVAPAPADETDMQRTARETAEKWRAEARRIRTWLQRREESPPLRDAEGAGTVTRWRNTSDRAHAIRTNLVLTIDDIRGALIGLGATWTRERNRFDAGRADEWLEVGGFDAEDGPAGAVGAAIEAALDGREPPLPLVTLASHERAALIAHWTTQRDLVAATLKQRLDVIRFRAEDFATPEFPVERVRQLMLNDWTDPRGREKVLPYDRVNPLLPIPVVAPLVLRARLGECVHLTLENELRDRRVGLHIQGDTLGRERHGDGVRAGDGSHVGGNPDSTLPPRTGERTPRTTYTYGATHEGVWMLGDVADVRGSEQATNIHGLFGALIVEPAKSTWRDPVTGRGLDETAYDSQLYVDVIPEADAGGASAALPYVDLHYDDVPRSYREFTVFLHDEPEVHSGLHAAGMHSWMPLSYRAEPMVNRLPHRMRRMVEKYETEHPEDGPAQQVPVDRNAFHWKLGDEFDDEFWTARTPEGTWLERIAGEEQHHSSWLFGEPATPILRAYAGDPCRVRLVHGGIKETHVYHLHVHQWRAVAADTAEPSVWGTDAAGDPLAKGSQLLDSITIGPQTAMTIDPLYGSGSRQHAPGDVIWHCHLYPHFHHGMWGLWRSFDRLVDGRIPYPDGTPCPALKALPGRTPTTGKDPATATSGVYPDGSIVGPDDHLGFPWFIDAQHPMKAPPPPAPDDDHVGGRRRLLGLPHASQSELDAMPERIRTGQVVSPGAVFVDLDAKAAAWNKAAGLPAPRIVSYDLHARMAPITYNSDGWHDPLGCHYHLDRVEVREEQTDGTYAITEMHQLPASAANPDPVFPRANHGDIVELRLHNDLASVGADQEDFAMHPVECGLHVHLVKFDVLSADGSSTGWNYLSGASCAEAVADAPAAALPANVSLHRWVVDEEFGPCFFHDHLLANYRQKHGLWSALIAEPHGSQWHRADDQSTTAWGDAQAIVVPAEPTGLPPYREACLGVQDFVPLQNRRGRALNPPTVLSGVDDPGVMAMSYRSAPMKYRGQDPSVWFSTAARVDDGASEPETPLIETYPGERLRIRLIQGSHEEGHNFQLHGLRWRRDWGNPRAPLVNQQPIGISEAFTLEIDPSDASPYGVGDHLWHLGGLDDLWLGCWGYIRALQPTAANHARVAPLPITGRSPMHPPTRAVSDAAATAPVRTFVVVAQRTEHLFDGAHLTDPWGLIYRVAQFRSKEFEQAQRTGIWRAKHVDPDDRPLVLRAHRGERIRVFLVNDLLNDDPIQAAALPRFSVEVAPPRLFVEHLDDLGRPDRRAVSPRLSLHASLLQFDVRSSDGSFVGRNPDQTVAPAPTREDHGAHVEGAGPMVHRGGHDGHDRNWREYTWFADDALGHESYRDGPGQVCVLKDMGDVRNHRHHGLIGALVVEPPDVDAWRPGTWHPDADPADSDGWHGVEAELRTRGGDLVAHEGVVFFQDGLRHFVDGQPGSPVSDVPLEDEPEVDSGQKALSYRTALIHRGKPPTDSAAGDPLVTAPVGVPIWLRAVGAGDKLRQHSFTLHGLAWERAPWVDGADWTACSSGVVGGWAQDCVVHPRHAGDHAVRTGSFRFGTEMGVWGVIRTE